MKIAFFGTKPYDRLWFEPLCGDYSCDIHFIESGLSEDTVILAKGADAIFLLMIMLRRILQKNSKILE